MRDNLYDDKEHFLSSNFSVMYTSCFDSVISFEEQN